MKKKHVIIPAVILVMILAAVNFPIYRLVSFGNTLAYFSLNELQKAIYIGSPWDILQARDVIVLADAAFSDVHHTQAENEENYGLLSQYATATDRYGDTAYNEHSLDLWSAHLGKEEGWIWVYYSSKTVHQDGSTARGSWNIPSLWKVKKNENGIWVVTGIKEHP